MDIIQSGAQSAQGGTYITYHTGWGWVGIASHWFYQLGNHLIFICFLYVEYHKSVISHRILMIYALIWLHMMDLDQIEFRFPYHYDLTTRIRYNCPCYFMLNTFSLHLI